MGRLLGGWQEGALETPAIPMYVTPTPPPSRHWEMTSSALHSVDGGSLSLR